MPEYDEIIEQSQENIKALSEKLKEIDSLYEDINSLTKSSKEIPEIFNSKFKEIIKVTDSYANSLGISTKKYLDGNNTLLANNLNNIQKEVNRLENIDFSSLFKELQKEFINKTRIDLEVELKRFEKISNLIQSHIDDLKKQIERLEKIDLEEHFDKLQKTLSDIFGAINSINLTLTDLTKNLTSITQSIGNIETIINKSQKEITGLIESYSKQTATHLANQDENAKTNVDLLTKKIKGLEEMNIMLKKEIKNNRIFQFIGVGLILAVLIYLIIKV
tara:strand:+ start:422 stop:1249 length:828 start_codon:yes stop_codon:yes gene_type:complete